MNTTTVINSLSEWVRNIMASASTNAMLGPSLLKHEPDVLNRLWQFESDYFTFTYGLPKWMISKAWENRRLLNEAFGRHIRDKGALPFIKKREELMVGRGLSDADIGVANFGLWSAYVVCLFCHSTRCSSNLSY